MAITKEFFVVDDEGNKMRAQQEIGAKRPKFVSDGISRGRLPDIFSVWPNGKFGEGVKLEPISGSGDCEFTSSDGRTYTRI